MRLIGLLLDPQGPTAHDFDREVQTASFPALYHLALAVQSWPDPRETQVQAARHLLAALIARYTGVLPDTGIEFRLYPALVVNALIQRGHLQEARDLVRNHFETPFYMELAQMGVLPRQTVDTALTQWFDHPVVQDILYSPWVAAGPCYRTMDAALWWAARGDTVSLQRLVRREESESRVLRSVAVAIDANAVPGFARAALALAQGDTTLALSRFLAFPDSMCPDAQQLRQVRFRLLAAAGRGTDAAAVFDGSHDRRVPILLKRARLAERLGDRPMAIKYYEFVAQAWLHADPELQPTVAEARASLERLVRFQPFRLSHRKGLTP